MNIHVDDEIKRFIEFIREKVNKNPPSPPYGPTGPIYEILNKDRDTLIIRGNQTEKEFEIRISEDKKGLPRQLFIDLNEKCKAAFGKSTPQYSTVNIFNKKSKSGLRTNIREIISFKNEEMYKKNIPDTVEYQIKTKPIPKSFDDRVYVSKDTTKVFNVRYSYAHEISIQGPIKDPETTFSEIRDRKRIEYDTKNGYKYVFTIVENKAHEKSYELEIEFKDLSVLSTSMVERALSFIATDLFYTNLSVDETENILRKMNQFIGKGEQRFEPPKPENIKDNDSVYELVNIPNNYEVTNKLDGERCYLMFYKGSIYSIQHVYSKIPFIQKLDQVYNDSADGNISFVDTELFENKYYFFDCYVYHGVLCTTNNTPLRKRLEQATSLAQFHPDLFVMKEFSSNLLVATERLLNTLDKSKNDGLIYTPTVYTKNLPVYKWKFTENMSIDFRVVEDKDNNYTLCVYTNTDKKGFTPFMIKANVATYQSDKKLNNNGIYEFTYNVQTQKFVLHRQRIDKDKPNFITVAISVWNDIMNPFESYKLLNLFRPLRHMRKCHNRIKGDLIEKYCKKKVVLDLGVGAGGDLWKYEKANIVKLYGVEPYEKNYTELKKRLAEHPNYTFQEKVNLLTVKAQDTAEIVDKVGLDGVDIVSSFFSLSFFFFKENPRDIDDLVQTISQNLKEGGFFIGTTIDGNVTKDYLESQQDHMLTFPGGFIKMDPATNRVTLDIQGTIVERQEESLVNFQLLTNKLAEVGIFLKEKDSEMFPKCGLKNVNEEKLNSFYRTFVFHKDEIRKDINNICKAKNIYDLVTTSDDERCFGLFRDVLKTQIKNVDIFPIDTKDIYKAMFEFYMIKKYINPIDSFNFIKALCIFGDRLHKTMILQKIPDSAVKLRDYKNKTDFPILKDQLVDSLEKLREKKINYGRVNPDGLMVYKDDTGLLVLLFFDYSMTEYDPKQYSDVEDAKKLLEFLNGPLVVSP